MGTAQHSDHLSLVSVLPAATSPLTSARAQLTSDPAARVVEHVPVSIHSRLCLPPITRGAALPAQPALPHQGCGTMLLQTPIQSGVTPSTWRHPPWRKPLLPSHLCPCDLHPTSRPHDFTSMAPSPAQASAVPVKCHRQWPQQQHLATCSQCSGLAPLDPSPA